MRASVSSFFAAKLGASIDQYEDAFAPISGSHPVDGLRIAIADGATESFLARIWAQHLVAGFGHHSKAGLGGTWTSIMTSWPEVVRDFVDEREKNGRPIQWFEEPGLARGGYATFLQLQTVQPKNEGRCRFLAWGVGDCCLFQVRGGRPVLLFPMTSADQFNYAPELVFSNDTYASLRQKRHGCQGEMQVGDLCYLMTDALAAWTLSRIEDGLPPWDLFESFAQPGAEPFCEWVRQAQTQGRLGDDDVTLIRVCFELE